MGIQARHIAADVVRLSLGSLGGEGLSEQSD
jgi:hypothetical protein